METESNQHNQPTMYKNIILITLFVMLGLLIAWHVLMPILGITLVISAGAWGVATASIMVMCIAILLFFLFTGAGVLLLGLFALIWTIIAIALFPLLFPILAPIFILMIALGYLIKKKKTC